MHRYVLLVHVLEHHTDCSTVDIEYILKLACVPPSQGDFVPGAVSCVTPGIFPILGTVTVSK